MFHGKVDSKKTYLELEKAPLMTPLQPKYNIQLRACIQLSLNNMGRLNRKKYIPA